jgi:hypothetical protein
MLSSDAWREENDPQHSSSRRDSPEPDDAPLNISSTEHRSDRKRDTDRTMEMFAKIAISDTALAPKQFRGHDTDAERTEQWLDKFNTYSAFRNISEDDRLQLFKLLMTDQAEDWLRSLPTTVVGDYKQLLQEFRKRYALTDIDRWKKASSMWSREQRPGESVDAYITDIKNAARVVPVRDETLLRFAMVRGLLPDVRLHVLQSGAMTLDDVIKAARVAEAALLASKPVTEVAQLKEQITQLINRLDAKSMVAVVDTAETNKRVTFSPRPIRQNEERTRSSSPHSRSSSVDQDQSRTPFRRSADNSVSGNRTMRMDNHNRRQWTTTSNRDVRYQQPARSQYQQPSFRSGCQNGRPTFERGPQQQQFQTMTSFNSRRQSEIGRCLNCGRSHENDRRYCSASNLNCFQCGRRGHIARLCRSAGRYNNSSMMTMPTQ